mmetsp:Transcript_13995/g.33220  ORF Transcript_13995/g.33220 Transcript_13995/m.33220 type:complete len:254 (+) Transcript_13995:332-1093(+)
MQKQQPNELSALLDGMKKGNSNSGILTDQDGRTHSLLNILGNYKESAGEGKNMKTVSSPLFSSSWHVSPTADFSSISSKDRKTKFEVTSQSPNNQAGSTRPVHAPSGKHKTRSVTCPSCDSTVDISNAHEQVCEICGESVSPTQASPAKPLSWVLSGKRVKIRTPSGIREVPVPFPDDGTQEPSPNQHLSGTALFGSAQAAFEAASKHNAASPKLQHQSSKGKGGSPNSEPPVGSFVVDVDSFIVGDEVGMWL